ncbi:MAG: LysM peptidoglycan-binding domain-containing protein [Opitutales bacterium]|nr:LysM peptidoglycan-binding domain-containing protein [Opitutales bacterium]
MKILKVFSLVIVLHMTLLVMLVLQPGCNTVSKTETAQAMRPMGDSTRSGLWVTNTKKEKKSNPQNVVKSYDRSLVAEDKVNRSLEYSETLNNEDFNNPAGRETEVASVYREGNDHFEYTVSRGDSLWTIATRNNVSMKDLIRYNGLNQKDRIHPGQVLLIPGQVAPVVAAIDTPVEPVKETPEYEEPVVAVAEVEDTKILEEKPEIVNSVASTDKEELLAPKKETQVIETGEGIYEVQPGDSLYIIAMQNNTSVEEIKKLNNLDKLLIIVGQKIKIPGKYQGPVETPASSFNTAFNDVPVEQFEDSRYLEHTVQPGEYPGLIARKYNMNVADLLHLNDIRNPRMLKVGATLKVVNPEQMRTQMAELNNFNETDTEAVATNEENVEPEATEEPSEMVRFEDYPVIRIGS